MNSLNLPRALRQIERDNDPTTAKLIADPSRDEDDPRSPADVGEVDSSSNDQGQSPPARDSKADASFQEDDAALQDAQIGESAPPFGVSADSCGSDADHSASAVGVGDAGDSPSDESVPPLEGGVADPTSNVNHPAPPLDLSTVGPTSNAESAPTLEGSAAEADNNDQDTGSAIEVVENQESAINDDPAPPPDGDPAPSPHVGDADSAPELFLRHFEMLHRLPPTTTARATWT